MFPTFVCDNFLLNDMSSQSCREYRHPPSQRAPSPLDHCRPSHYTNPQFRPHLWPLQAAIPHQIPLLSLQSQTIETKWKEYLNFAPVLYTNSVCSGAGITQG